MSIKIFEQLFTNRDEPRSAHKRQNKIINIANKIFMANSM